MTHICHGCGIELTDENCYPADLKNRIYICKECKSEQAWLWRKANPKKARAIGIRASRKQGHRSFKENKDCPVFLGVHVAEQVLSHVFKDVERMPMGNKGYDFICNRGKKIDVKSSCVGHQTEWKFYIGHNTTADYFLCLAFDNRENLTPMHAWLLPGSKFKHLVCTSIRPHTIARWAEYRLDISKIRDCCDAIKETGGRTL